MIFVQILLGILLALVILILVGWWWLRSKFRGITQEVLRRMPYVPDFEARVRLIAAREGDALLEDEELATLKEIEHDLGVAGFTSVGQFTAREDGAITTCYQREGKLFALAYFFNGRIAVDYCALGEDNRAFLTTANPVFPALDTSSVLVRVDPHLAMAEGIAWLEQQAPLRALSTRQWVLLYERIYAACMDARIADPQCARLLEDWITFARLDPPADEDREAIEQDCQAQYQDMLQVALLDNARKALKLDEDSWSRIEDSVVIVHRATDFEDIKSFFDQELVEDLVDQFEALNMGVMKSFNAVNRRLTQERQFLPLVQVSRPVPAQLFVPYSHLDSIDREIPAMESGPGLKRFLYQSLDPDGDVEKSSWVAASVADARTQLQRHGHTDVRILSANHELIPIEQIDMEELAAVTVDSHQDSLAKTMGKILLGNAIAWVPFLLWSAWAWVQGPPYQWHDWLAFALATVTLTWTLFQTLPTFFYNASQDARAWGQPEKARKYFRWLRATGASGLKPAQLDCEEAKLVAEAGDFEAAKAMLDRHQKHMAELEYLSHLATLHDAARHYPAMVESHAQMLRLAPDNAEFKVELALSLLRHTDRLDEAENLLRGVHARDCSQLVVGGLRFAQGLLAGRRGRFGEAVNHLQQALREIQFFSNPLIQGFCAEIGGYMAAFLRQAGKHEEAEQVWGLYAPRLEALRADHVLTRYTQA